MFKANTTSDKELEEYAKRLGITLTGVYSRDDTLQLEPGEAAIVNLDPDMPGSHWVAVRRTPRSVLYFDSYGYPPPKNISEKWPKVRFTTKKVQSMKSTSCGYFCLWWLRDVHTLKQYSEWLKQFTSSVQAEMKIQAWIDGNLRTSE